MSLVRFGLPVSLLLGGCSRSPAQDVLGSFFPAWLLCAGIGVVAAAAAHRILALVGVAGQVPAAPLVFIAFAAAVTLLVWLCWGGG